MSLLCITHPHPRYRRSSHFHYSPFAILHSAFMASSLRALIIYAEGVISSSPRLADRASRSEALADYLGKRSPHPPTPTRVADNHSLASATLLAPQATPSCGMAHARASTSCPNSSHPCNLSCATPANAWPWLNRNPLMAIPLSRCLLPTTCCLLPFPLRLTPHLPAFSLQFDHPPGYNACRLLGGNSHPCAWLFFYV